ncbi:DUF6134 family protein [Fodinicurvata fenggangensis]|uniref:DUF6134 family protein n=1 Tax=Fodinicurvata fenggangensis TaxID=1121830 RepID=UPI00047A6561|nr:DUF6134 family protein [Fodinicurvata fenggangensis]
MDRRERLSFIPAVCLMVFLAALSTAGVANAQVLDDAEFRIRLNGFPVGEHHLRVERKGERVIAQQKGEATIQIGPIVITRVSQETEEILENGELVELNITNTNGYYNEKVRHITARRGEDGEIHLNDDGDRDHVLPASALPATGWNPEALRAPVLIRPHKGRPSDVPSDIEVIHHGEETINTPAGRFQTESWEMTGDLRARLWYDKESQNLVRVVFRYKGNKVEYERLP